MRALFAGLDRDDTGAFILGDPDGECAWCGAPAEATYDREAGLVVWWHPPVECCDRRRAHQVAAARARAKDEAAWRAEERSSLERSR